jgi:hypothetical protein
VAIQNMQEIRFDRDAARKVTGMRLKAERLTWRAGGGVIPSFLSASVSQLSFGRDGRLHLTLTTRVSRRFNALRTQDATS